ncbi:MAG: amidohydrolase [Salibacteraceae bacterium]
MDIQKLTKFRKELHAHPELSSKETETQQRIAQFLEQHGIRHGTRVGGTGLLYSMSFGDGPHVLVRVDCDALPIQEINDFEHRSKYDGVSHKCGHDGHTAIGAGLLLKLNQEPLKAGNVDVLFQPAEEIGEGAKAVIADPKFNIDQYDYAMALHNIPGIEMNEIVTKKEEFTPAVQSLVIRLTGKTSHAAEPLKGQNPAYAISEIIHLAKTMEVTDEQHTDYALITPVYSTLGSIDYGISAGYGEVHFTIRSWKQQKMERVTEIFTGLVQTISETNELSLETEILAVFAANFNDNRVVDGMIKAAKDLNLKHNARSKPMPWGEDFGLFTQKIPGAMFGLGSGTSTPALHNPDYDYPDQITETGINMFYETLSNLIND